MLFRSITGVFFRYVTPGVIGMVGMSLYILADTYFIANGVGRLGPVSYTHLYPESDEYRWWSA